MIVRYGLAAALALVLYAMPGQSQAAEPAPRAEAKPAAELPPQPTQPFQMGPAESYRSIVERPLFSPYRRSPPPAEGGGDTSVAAAPTKNNLDLTGIMIGRDMAVATLRDRTTAKYFAGHVGDVIGGWTVSEITEDSVVLTQGATTERIEQIRKANWPALGATPNSGRPKSGTAPGAAAPAPAPAVQLPTPVTPAVASPIPLPQPPPVNPFPGTVGAAPMAPSPPLPGRR